MNNWILVEGDRLLHAESGIVVQFNKQDSYATVWGYGVILIADSKAVGEHYGKIRDQILAERAAASNVDKQGA